MIVAYILLALACLAAFGAVALFAAAMARVPAAREEAFYELHGGRE